MDPQTQKTMADEYVKEIKMCRAWDDFLILQKKFDEFVCGKNDEVKALFNAHGITERIPANIKTFFSGIFTGYNYIQNSPCTSCSSKPQNVTILNTPCQFEQSCLCSKNSYPICSTCVSEQIGGEITCQILCKTCKGTFCLFGLTEGPIHSHHTSSQELLLPDFETGHDDQFSFQSFDEVIYPPPQPLDVAPQFRQQIPFNTEYEYDLLESGTAPDISYPQLFDREIDPSATPTEKIEIRLKDVQQILIVFGQRINRGTDNEKLLLRSSELMVDIFKDLTLMNVPQPRVVEEPTYNKFPIKKLESNVKKRTRSYKCNVCGRRDPGHYEKKCPGPTLVALAQVASRKLKVNPHHSYDDGED